MIVAMTISMSGGRDDDRPWPGIGVPFEVTKAEGEGLVRWGHAVDLDDRVKPAQLAPNLRLPGTPHVSAPGPVSLPAETAAGPVDNPPPDPGPVYSSGDLADDAADLADNAADLAAGDVSADEPAEDDEPEPETQPEPPKPADPKQAWIDYAVSGAPVADRIPEPQASGMSKADLMSRYGGRL
jgi:hypothetical protein